MKNMYGFDIEARHELLRRFYLAMQGAEPMYYLSHGTLLAAYRDGTWIPHDSDIDIDMMREEITEEAFDVMVQNLKDRELTVRGSFKSTSLGVYYGGETLAIRRLELLGQWRIYRDIGTYYARMWDEANVETISFFGMTFFAPGPIEEFLEDLYIDWKTPMKEDHGFDVKAYNEKCWKRRVDEKIRLKNETG